MATTTEEARRDLLAQLADATDELALAIACLSEAYELLDDATADRLEREMFRPIQIAYGRAKKTHADFANRSGLARRAFEQQSGGLPSQGARKLIENGVDAAARADGAIAALQDSLLPTEFGDAELRAGLANVRELIGAVPLRARNLLSTLGR